MSRPDLIVSEPQPAARLWLDTRLGVAVAITVGGLAGLAVAVTMPRGPLTTAQALTTIGLSCKRIHTFENAGHSVAFEQFEALSEILRDTVLPETYTKD